MSRSEFDLLELPEVFAVLDALKARDDFQASRDAQLFCHILNAPHFQRKGEKPYSPYDFLPESDEDRANREQARLIKSLEALKALTANSSKTQEAKSMGRKAKSQDSADD